TTVPRPGGDNPVHMPDDAVFQRGADEIGNCNCQGSIVFDPPHIVMGIDMDENSFLYTGVAPNVVSLVMILHEADVLNGVDTNSTRVSRQRGEGGDCGAAHCETPSSASRRA